MLHIAVDGIAVVVQTEALTLEDIIIKFPLEKLQAYESMQ